MNIAVGDVVMVRIDQTDGVSRYFNVLHYECLGFRESPTSPVVTEVSNAFVAMNNFVGALQTALRTPWKTITGDSFEWDRTSFQKITGSPRSALYSRASGVGAGSLEDPPLPTQDCLTILKRSESGERWGMGRYFHSGLTESNTEGSEVTAAFATGVNVFASLLADIVEAPYQEGLTGQWLPIILGPLPEGGFRKTRIDEARLSDNIIKTQRRRRPGKGI